MKVWCKIFKHEEHGQVVVTNTTSDENDPAVNISWYPNWEYAGMLSINMVFTSEEDCDEAFGKVNESETIDVVNKTVSDARSSFGG